MDRRAVNGDSADKGCAECTDWGNGNCVFGCFHLRPKPHLPNWQPWHYQPRHDRWMRVCAHWNCADRESIDGVGFTHEQTEATR